MYHPFSILAIMLSPFKKYSIDELIKAIMTLDEEVITCHNLEQMLKYLPSEAEV